MEITEDCSHWALPITIDSSRLPHSYFGSLWCCLGKAIRRLMLLHLSPHLHFTQTKLQWKGEDTFIPLGFRVVNCWRMKMTAPKNKEFAFTMNSLFWRSLPAVLGEGTSSHDQVQEVFNSNRRVGRAGISIPTGSITKWAQIAKETLSSKIQLETVFLRIILYKSYSEEQLKQLCNSIF